MGIGGIVVALQVSNERRLLMTLMRVWRVTSHILSLCQSSAVSAGLCLYLLVFLSVWNCLFVCLSDQLSVFISFRLLAWQVCQSIYLYFSLSPLSVSKWEWGETGWGCLVEQRKFLMHDPSTQAWTASCQSASSLFGFCVWHQLCIAWIHSQEVIYRINDTSPATKGHDHCMLGGSLSVCCYYAGDSGLKTNKKYSKGQALSHSIWMCSELLPVL